jgi:hypothetical protein
MTEAIFGLIGVIVGGVLTSALESVRERGRERAETRAAARLLSAELSVQQGILAAFLAGDRAALVDDQVLAVSQWSEYRALMAKVLSDEAWQKVASAFVKLMLWRRDAGGAWAGTGEDRREWTLGLHDEVEEARRLLRRR